jgi:hypothetical protein
MVVAINDVPGLIPADLLRPLRDPPLAALIKPIQDFALVFIVRDLYHRMGLHGGGRLARRLSAESHPPTLDRIEKGWGLFEAEFGRIVSICGDNHVPLIILASPHAAPFTFPDSEAGCQKRIARLAAQHHLPFLDPFPEFAARPAPPFIAPDPIHPSPEGHLIMAELIAGQLAKTPGFPPP